MKPPIEQALRKQIDFAIRRKVEPVVKQFLGAKDLPDIEIFKATKLVDGQDAAELIRIIRYGDDSQVAALKEFAQTPVKVAIRRAILEIKDMVEDLKAREKEESQASTRVIKDHFANQRARTPFKYGLNSTLETAAVDQYIQTMHELVDHYYSKVLDAKAKSISATIRLLHSAVRRAFAHTERDPHIGTFRIKPGDHIKIGCGMWPLRYYHHGIYVGSNKVVHWINCGDIRSRGPAGYKGMKFNSVLLTNSWAFCDGAFERVEVESYELDCSDVEIVIDRALNSVGENGNKMGEYHFINNNCEHHARFCKTGVAKCKQVAEKLYAASKTSKGVGFIAGIVSLVAKFASPRNRINLLLKNAFNSHPFLHPAGLFLVAIGTVLEVWAECPEVGDRRLKGGCP